MSGTPHRRHAEHSVLLGDAEIAPQSKFEAARNCISGHGGNHRLRQKHPRWAHRCGGTVRANPVFPITWTEECFQIRARAKRAVIAVEDPGARLIVGLESLESLNQFRRRFRIDGISRFRTAHDDGCNGTIALDCYGHGNLLFLISPTIFEMSPLLNDHQV
jgi:hypothetical protein